MWVKLSHVLGKLWIILVRTTRSLPEAQRKYEIFETYTNLTEVLTGMKKGKVNMAKEQSGCAPTFAKNANSLAQKRPEGYTHALCIAEVLYHIPWKLNDNVLNPRHFLPQSLGSVVLCEAPWVHVGPGEVDELLGKGMTGTALFA